jgi:hypothetical protein
VHLLFAAVVQKRHLGALLAFHQIWGYGVIVGNGLAGIWALVAHRNTQLRTRALWWFTFFVEAAVFIQVGTGIGMVAGEHAHPVAFHPFYGFFAVVVVGFLYAYREQLRHRIYLLYGFGGLFIMGVGIRALITARH